MLYKIAHLLRERLSLLWRFIECINSMLFSFRFGKRITAFAFTTIPDGYNIVSIKELATEKLVAFFNKQPEEAFSYFHPHGFDEISISRLQKDKAFLGYVLMDITNYQIAGYCFIRCFFLGKGFRGRMVDINYRGKGLGTAMNIMLNELGFHIGLRLFETVSMNNVASYRSALSASKVMVVNKMDDNVLLIEVLPE